MDVSRATPLPRIAIVIPCYNESDIFLMSLKELRDLLLSMINKKEILYNSYLLFIDDGSKDQTWKQIEEASERFNHVQGIKLSRNVGHQSALLAGLECVNQKVDAVISIDADLQDDIMAIPKMVAAYRQGHDVVYGVRSCRDADSWFKRTTAETFYRIMRIAGVRQIPNHADFRLLSQRALKALLEYKENNIYLRGLIPLLGFSSTNIYYKRGTRMAGESKYPLSKMISLAVEGITSMTILPLRIIIFTGFFILIFSFSIFIYIIFLKISGKTILIWPLLMSVICFIGGVQTFSLGIIGEYIGKIYMEVKKRPRYHAERYAGAVTKKQ